MSGLPSGLSAAVLSSTVNDQQSGTITIVTTSGVFAKMGHLGTYQFGNVSQMSGGQFGQPALWLAKRSALPTIQLTPPNSGTDNGQPFTATALVAGFTGPGAPSLEGVPVTVRYYASARGTPIAGPPVNVGTYTVVASFAGSASYIQCQSIGDIHDQRGRAQGQRHDAWRRGDAQTTFRDGHDRRDQRPLQHEPGKCEFDHYLITPAPPPMAKFWRDLPSTRAFTPSWFRSLAATTTRPPESQRLSPSAKSSRPRSSGRKQPGRKAGAEPTAR